MNISDLRVIISGGSGLLGKCLSLEFAKSGFEVLVLSRQSKIPKIFEAEKNIKLLKWDAKSSKDWGDHIDSSTIVINLAGENPGSSRWNDDVKNKILESRMSSIKAMEEAICKHKPLAFIQASAVGIYGNCPNDIVILDKVDLVDSLEHQIEQSEGAIFRREVCIKLENYCKEFIEKLNLQKKSTSLLLLRLGCILSNQSGVYPHLLMASRCGISKIGDGNQIMSWIDIQDAANSVVFLTKKLVEGKTDLDGAYHISSPTICTNKELFSSLSKHYYGIPRLIPFPSSIFSTAFGDSSSVILDSQPVMPDRLNDLGFEFCYKTIDESIKKLSENPYH